MRRRRQDDGDRATLAPGQLAVPNIRLVRKIAEGGMGSVWEGEHLSLRTNVAVKFVAAELDDNAEAKARFEREATSAARIRSPHVVQVLDHGLTTDEDVPYIVMELLEGEDLEARIDRESRLHLDLVAHIVIQTAKALSKAHALGIVHRDIKPSNIFLTEEGGEVFVKVLDFGIAKLTVADVSRMRVTQTGAMIGTPVYMAPEQMTQAKDAGPQADIWSVGVVAYLALTGLLPYDSDTVAGLAMAIERGRYPQASNLADDLPREIDAWFEKTLAKDPAARFQNVREMAEALSKIAGIKAAPASVLSPTSTPPPAITGFASDPPPRASGPPDAARGAATVREGALYPNRGKSSDRPPASAARSALGDRTVMGASSHSARSDAQSTTRTVLWAGGVLAILGVIAATFAALRGGDGQPATAGDVPALSAPSAPADSAAAPGASTAPEASATAALSGVPEVSAAASASMAPTASAAPIKPALTGKLPTAPSAKPAPSAVPAPSAGPAPTGGTSAKPTSSAAPKPATSGAPSTPAAPASQKPPAPAAPPTKPAGK